VGPLNPSPTVTTVEDAVELWVGWLVGELPSGARTKEVNHEMLVLQTHLQYPTPRVHD
jgi:hypothetical protein